MKKILIIAYDCNPQKGAEAMMAYNWISSLAKNYKVKVITDIRHKACLNAKDNSFDIEYVTYTSEKIYSLLEKLHAYNILYRLFIKAFRKKLSLSEIDTYDLIHCLTPAGYFSYNDLYKLSKPLVVGPLGGGLKLPKGFGRYKTFKYFLRNIYYSCIRHNPKWKKYLNNCSKILIGTKYLLEHLPKSVHSKTFELFDTVVDTNKYLPCYQRENGTINILYSGRMELSKGCLLILEAYKLLIQEGYTQLRLTMLGEGSQLFRIKKKIKKAHLEQYIKLPGCVSADDVKEYLHKSDIYCLPSLKEPGGTSILEAMACGFQ
jgi:glycosyltransferase involved in cell wall biosynthesis